MKHSDEEAEEGTTDIATDSCNLMKPDIDSAPGKYRCKICDNVMVTKMSFNAHRWRKHGTIRHSLVCPVDPNCAKLPSAKSLRRHLKERHVSGEEGVKHSFQTEEDYLHWKEELQKKSNSQFVRRSTASATGCEIWYCNRAGKRRLHEKAAEGKKSKATWGKGSEKMGGHCPAAINVKYGSNRSVEVTAFLSHVGHDDDICYLSLSTTLYEEIKEKLREGYAPDQIASFLRKKPDASTRDKLIRTKDVLNVLRHDLPELIGYYHKNDHVSIDMAVLHFSKLGEETPIFYYRPRRREEDTFAIGIQTVSQRALLEQFNGNVVCLDMTHKPCHYDGYLLGTLLVLDLTGAGQPVAWYLVKGESEAEMAPIFAALKQRHPNLRPKYFMSDCAQSFWNAWRAVFGHEGIHRLWCKWHVWRAWTGHIARVSEEKRRHELREMLKNLLQALTETDFDMMYFGYLQVMKNQAYLMVSKKKEKPSQTFGDYFDREYVKNGLSKLWSRYGRLDCDISTNMHLESFHRTLKKRYLKRMCNRQIDFVVHTLVTKVAVDFAFQFERSLVMRGKSSTHQQHASKDHEKAKYLLDKPSRINEIEEGKIWMVQSSTEIGLHKVARLNSGCLPNSCHIKCQQCQVCPHQYFCSCPRFAVGGRMPCKHVHAIHSLFQEIDEAEDDEEEVDIVSLPEPEPVRVLLPAELETVGVLLPAELEPVGVLLPAEPELVGADPELIFIRSAEGKGTLTEPESLTVLVDKRTTIMHQLETLKTLIARCDSIAQVEEVQQQLQTSIDKLQLLTGPEYSAVPLSIGAQMRKRKMSPQKTSALKLLALAKKPKKKNGLSTSEKDANIRVQEKLKLLDRVLPLCSVCDEERDSHDNIAEKCSKCNCWCHIACRHVCIV